jgi:hypothetical protein
MKPVSTFLRWRSSRVETFEQLWCHALVHLELAVESRVPCVVSYFVGIRVAAVGSLVHAFLCEWAHTLHQQMLIHVHREVHRVLWHSLPSFKPLFRCPLLCEVLPAHLREDSPPPPIAYSFPLRNYLLVYAAVLTRVWHPDSRGWALPGLLSGLLTVVFPACDKHKPHWSSCSWWQVST